jgi:hypothetical protein
VSDFQPDGEKNWQGDAVGLDQTLAGFEDICAATVAAHARNDVLAIATRAGQNGAAFSDTLIRRCTKMAPPPLAGCPDG